MSGWLGGWMVGCMGRLMHGWLCGCMGGGWLVGWMGCNEVCMVGGMSYLWVEGHNRKQWPLELK